MEPGNVPKKVNRHLLKALDFLQSSKTDFVSVDAIQNRVRWSLRRTKPVEDLENMVMESLKTQTDLGIITRYGSSMYAKALGFPGVPPKKVNKHVLKALRSLQTSETEFISVDDIQDRVKRSLRHTKPLSNLDELITECLKKQTQLGIVTRSGATKYAMNRAFNKQRPVKNEPKIENNEPSEQWSKSLTEDEDIMRKILLKVKKPSAKPSESHKPMKVRPKYCREK